jgi:protein SCO1/2
MAHMRDRTSCYTRCFFDAFFATAIFLVAGVAGCGSQKPAQTEEQQQQQGPKRYQLAGRVVSVDAAKQQLVVDHGDIPGFMMAMTMPYPVKSSDQLTSVSPEDQITADVVVNGDDVHLENIVVVKKAANPGKAPASSPSQPASSQPTKK